MKRTAILLTVLSFCAVSVVAAQQGGTAAPKAAAPKPAAKSGTAVPARPTVSGSWDVTTRMPSGAVKEKWTVKQDGDKISGTVKTADGQEYPIDGEMVPPGYFFRVSVKFPDGEHLVRATADKDAMDGSITIGRAEHLWSATKSK